MELKSTEVSESTRRLTPENHGVRFLHIRQHEYVSTMSNARRSTPSSRGGWTFAYELVKIDDSSDQPFMYRYALSKCHSSDNFNKKIGRAAAAGRLKSAHFTRVVKAASRKEFLNFLNEISEEITPAVFRDGVSEAELLNLVARNRNLNVYAY